jgi:hypothetical protein
VCGGAFTGPEKIISARGRQGSIGFEAKVIAPEDRKQARFSSKVASCPQSPRRRFRYVDRPRWRCRQLSTNISTWTT